MHEYVPVEVRKGLNKEYWLIDVSELGLGKLIMFRKELHGTSDRTVTVLDGIIYKRIGTKHRYVYQSIYTDAKEAKRHMKLEKKKRLIKMERGMIR